MAACPGMLLFLAKELFSGCSGTHHVDQAGLDLRDIYLLLPLSTRLARHFPRAYHVLTRCWKWDLLEFETNEVSVLSNLHLPGGINKTIWE